MLIDESDPPPREVGLRFRLTYDGKLCAPTGGNNRVNHKHEIRKAFHPQLRRLWETSLQLAETHPHRPVMWMNEEQPPPHTIKDLAPRFERCGYKFVPLVTHDIATYCEIDILFLRPDVPGNLIESGDVDNRLKTLLDALQIIRDRSQLGKYQAPEEGEEPFFCLLEDDKLIPFIPLKHV